MKRLKPKVTKDGIIISFQFTKAEIKEMLNITEHDEEDRKHIKKGLHRLMYNTNVYAAYVHEMGWLKHELDIEKGNTINITDVYEGIVYFTYQKTDFKSAEHHIIKYFEPVESEK